eukprot:TRINITY_DN8285_c0_g1_i1.p1 TRINITY_DN8285_c0_g1~~TRINITY_DN8285_c0_g1_i1.p1  ORF type:complete len:458 (+),score=77.29 TRINITY_DN8285_c0_g1_i1:179-1375(+)
MSDFIYDYDFLSLTIPGTHDSGAYSLEFAFSPGNNKLLEDLVEIAKRFDIPAFELIRVWALAQNRTFYEQMYDGIRYFDLRCCWDVGTNAWRTFHMILGNPIQVLVDDIVRFLTDFPGEVVIVEASHFDGSDPTTRAALADMFEKTFGDLLLPRLQFSTVGDMVKSNQRVLLTFDDEATIADRPNIWPSNVLTGSYANTPKAPVMIAWNQHKIETLGGDGSLFELSWTLTTDGDAVIEGLLDPFGFPDTLHRLAREGNWFLEGFARNNSQYFLGNMVLVDQEQESYVVEVAKTRNRRQCFDDSQYRAVQPSGQDCRTWMQNNNCTNAFVRQHCPLSCGLCAPVVGEPGDACTVAAHCLSGQCVKSVCLVDDPRQNGEPCGSDLQCATVQCNRKENYCE